MSIPELKQLERKLDGEVAALEVWKLPVRVVLLALHHGLYSFFRVDREKASTVAGRMSYLLDLLAKCPAEPTGTNALEAFGAYAETDPKLQQVMLAIQYGHFSEIMPQVHRGTFTVTKVAEKHFRLDYASSEIAAADSRDIVLSELAMPHLAVPSPPLQEEIQQLAEMAPRADVKLMGSVLGTYIDHFLNHIVEPTLLPDETLLKAFGVTNSELSRFTAILLGIASCAIALSRAVEPRVTAESQNETEIEGEWLEWISIFWQEDFLRKLLSAATNDASKMDALLSIFALDFRVNPAQTKHGGEGYFPPLALLPGSGVVIGPYFTLLFAHTRNVLYALRRLDQTKFDEVVSEGLEPQLLVHAQALLKRQPGIEMKPNVVWGAGEIDLLVYEESSNTALQIQVKAVLAPYGARMVERLEDRVQEGMRQLRTFRDLPQTQIDAILSNGLGRTIRNAHLQDAILVRSCFGSQRTWGNANEVCFLSLAMLSELTKSGRLSSLADMAATARDYLDSVLKRANPVWKHKPLQIGEWLLDVPMLDLDQAFLDRERIKVWSNTMHQVGR